MAKPGIICSTRQTKGKIPGEGDLGRVARRIREQGALSDERRGARRALAFRTLGQLAHDCQRGPDQGQDPRLESLILGEERAKKQARFAYKPLQTLVARVLK